jgi:translation elongation factor EF-1alpha
MITGAVQADYAILVIDVSRFESSFMFGGQTK